MTKCSYNIYMQIEFDPSKDLSNVEKHGISLSRSADLTALAYVEDERFEEARFRLYGLIDDIPHCLAGTWRGDVIRVISLRRAHDKEVRRYAPQARSGL